ncbi:hypothetical protein I602_278 [Polaribacter dokdonensis DSW-5]|uniref:Cytochrome c domain-containing protein n=2 Tax=Polaribacter dokdonensis DSW-5 TaxID=1300348 RepID=A0A0N0UN64_9FLAO|nr:hypothetical protein I602_278 [Polaribacter dokdonensis DSW-5]
MFNLLSNKITNMKLFIKLKTTLPLVCISLFFMSCLTNVEEPIVDENPNVDPCSTITYSANIKSIIDINCVQCHGNGGNFPDLTTYENTRANADLVKAETQSRRMPQGSSLTNTEIEAIACWVDAGALNN